jgi:predicted DNA-binding protein
MKKSEVLKNIIHHLKRTKFYLKKTKIDIVEDLIEDIDEDVLFFEENLKRVKEREKQ